ncbi:MAG: hypothetical protein Q4D98_07125 [Planctomycetia bacterium]|nr:hypothetical protein [Planctomycetia bacterium]
MKLLWMATFLWVATSRILLGQEGGDTIDVSAIQRQVEEVKVLLRTYPKTPSQKHPLGKRIQELLRSLEESTQKENRCYWDVLYPLVSQYFDLATHSQGDFPPFLTETFGGIAEKLFTLKIPEIDRDGKRFFLLSHVSFHPYFSEKIQKNRAYYTEKYFSWLQKYRDAFSPQAEKHAQELLKQWDTYYHSTEYPPFRLPLAGSFQTPAEYPEKYPSHYVPDKKQREKYQAMSERYAQGRHELIAISQRKKRYPTEVLPQVHSWILRFYSSNPASLEELETLMKNRIETSLQNEILKSVEKAENPPINF